MQAREIFTIHASPQGIRQAIRATMIEIERASPDQAAKLTEIAHSAKASWGYPARWLEIWRDALTLTPAFISANPVFVACEEGVPVAFVALTQLAEDRGALEHLWVAPSHIEKGIGPMLVRFALEHARSLGIEALAIDAEPLAESFYRRMGAVRVGEVRGVVDGEPRVRPQLLLRTGAE